MDTTKPAVVFVHGAWADNSGFDRSIRALRGQGLAKPFWVLRAARVRAELSRYAPSATPTFITT